MAGISTGINLLTVSERSIGLFFFPSDGFTLADPPPLSAGIAYIEYKFKDNGVIQRTKTVNGTNPGYDDSNYYWSLPTLSGIGSGYDVRASSLTGSVGGSIVGTWYNLGVAEPFWFISQNSYGTASGTVTIEIRDSTTLSIIDSKTLSLAITRNS